MAVPTIAKESSIQYQQTHKTILLKRKINEMTQLTISWSTTLKQWLRNSET